MDREVNIVDIARAAGVSIATVSNVINGKGRVSTRTSQRVQALIKEMGYTPNLHARNLKTRRTDLIGLLVPTLQPGRLQDNPFYWDLLAGVEEIARERQFHIILTGIDEATETFSFVKERRLDGLIVTGTNEGSPAVGRIAELGVPAVFVDSYLQDADYCQVCIEDRKGSFMATEYLIRSGHRRIALLLGDVPQEKIRDYGVLHERWLGYKEALEQAGIDYDPDLIIRLHNSLEGGYDAVDKLLAMEDVTAVFAFSDVSAMGLLKGLVDRNIKVPENFSVVGFDNLSISQYTRPSLTTVSQNILEKGRLAANMLFTLIDGQPVRERTVTLPVELIVRETTGPAVK